MTGTQEIVWGPAIAVDGKRPGWLKDGTPGMFENRPGEWLKQTHDVTAWCWAEKANDGKGCPIRIRLPADHPHYRQPAQEAAQPTPQADTKPDVTAELEDLAQQLAALSERHEALSERVARMAQPSAIRTMDLKLDPDLIEARKLVAERTGRLQIECGYSHSVLNGEQDDHPAVINTLTAIKRGRELALAGETGK